MKTLITALFLVLLFLQYPLWFGNGSALEVWRLRQSIEAQQREDERLQERNRSLEAEVIDLKSGVHAIEERARAELGMIKKGETFYQVVE